MEQKQKKVIEHTTSETVKEMDEASEIKAMKKLEAALFLSARFLSVEDLIMFTDINPLMLKELINRLIEKYNSNESAIEIVIKENMWKMDVKQEYVSMINKLATGSAEFSKTEQETLAVIAYKQPVKQSVVIKIRGNKAYEHVKKFIEIGLVKAKKLGHTKELRLSDDFYEYFHLKDKKLEKIENTSNFQNNDGEEDIAKIEQTENKILIDENIEKEDSEK